MRILFIGEVVGGAGVYCIKALLPGLKRELDIDLTIAAAEGATGGFGLGKGHSIYLHKLGVDVITTGDFAYFKRDMVGHIAQARYLLRPANYPYGNPGRGWLVARPRPPAHREGPRRERADAAARAPEAAADAQPATAATPDATPPADATSPSGSTRLPVAIGPGPLRSRRARAAPAPQPLRRHPCDLPAPRQEGARRLGQAVLQLPTCTSAALPFHQSTVASIDRVKPDSASCWEDFHATTTAEEGGP